ncbi:hypothetical protein BC829DRAFT_418416 [Chytridium lagenaria]|nr:hypothetical protein BC829DRAFT_418416 [Chytridium lagenaria]
MAIDSRRERFKQVDGGRRRAIVACLKMQFAHLRELDNSKQDGGDQIRSSSTAASAHKTDSTQSITPSVAPQTQAKLNHRTSNSTPPPSQPTPPRSSHPSTPALEEDQDTPTSYIDQHEIDYQEQQDKLLKLLHDIEKESCAKKFVCTTIRPTQLPFKELYDYRSCAKFVSDYLSYEVLEPPHELPFLLRSPTYTLRVQSGNCFDYSVLLVSLLRGFGYDAYVVSGYATRDITIMDETRTDSDTVGIRSPYATGGEKDKDLKGDKDDGGKGSNGGKYKVKPPRQLRSMFLLKQEEKKRLQEIREQEAMRIEMERQRALMNEDDDELKGLRIHAWVLVLPGKQPSTGKIFPTDNDNYLGVESVFSSTNYWVNMQVCYDGLRGIHFDLGDNSKWEFVLLDNTQPGVASKNLDAVAENGDGSEDEEEEESTSEILDLPPSWVDKIAVTREQFESRCPSGSKVITYKNARHEIFAEYHRTDGMISRITFFADDLKGFHGEIREKFKNRKDKLIERIRVPHLGQIQEHFDPGRPHGLKEHVMIDGETTELHFFPSARSDGLVKRVEGDFKVMEYFIEREDRLIYRSATFEKTEESTVRDRTTITKMTEKFDRNRDLPTSEDAAKKSTSYLQTRYNPARRHSLIPKIKVIYHLEDARIIPSSRDFKKPTADQKTSMLELPYSFEVVSSYFFLNTNLRKARQGEEKEVSLIISVYDTIRNNTGSDTAQRLANEEEKDAHKGDEEENKITNLDYLSPYLVNYPNQTVLNRDESILVKDSCLKSLKERLIEKANIIQGRLEEVTAEYQRRQLAYSRNADSMTVEETDEYVRFCNEALFKIHILEKRLAKHKESAPEKYIELDGKLKSDLRLLPAFQNIK